MDILHFLSIQEQGENPEIQEVITEGTDTSFHPVCLQYGVQIAVRRLPDGWGVFAYNCEIEPRIVYISFADCKICGTYRVRNIRKREDQGFAEKEIPVTIDAEDCALFRLISLS